MTEVDQKQLGRTLWNIAGATSSASARRAQAKRSKTQNRGARNVNSFGQHRPFARARAILQFAVRATWPQNAGRKTRKIAGRNVPLARPRHAAPAVPANRASQNHPPSGENTRNPSRNSPPPLENMPKNPQNRVSLATRRNSQPATGSSDRGRGAHSPELVEREAVEGPTRPVFVFSGPVCALSRPQKNTQGAKD